MAFFSRNEEWARGKVKEIVKTKYSAQVLARVTRLAEFSPNGMHIDHPEQFFSTYQGSMLW
jgi:hypothetical protein